MLLCMLHLHRNFPDNLSQLFQGSQCSVYMLNLPNKIPDLVEILRMI